MASDSNNGFLSKEEFLSRFKQAYLNKPETNLPSRSEFMARFEKAYLNPDQTQSASSSLPPPQYSQPTKSDQELADEYENTHWLGGDFGRAVRRGTLGMGESLMGFGETVSDFLGARETKNWFKSSGDYLNEWQKTMPARISDLRQVKSFGDLATLAIESIGQIAPQVAAALIPGTLASKGVAGLISKAPGLAKALGLAEMATIGGEEVAIATKGAEKTARFLGAVGATAPQEIGGNYRGIRDETGMESPMAATVTGFASGLAEAWTPFSLIENMMKSSTRKVGESIWKHLFKETVVEAAKAAGGEFTTEALQEGLSISANWLADRTYSVANKNNMWRVLTAGTMGLLGGGAMGGGSALLHNAMLGLANPDTTADKRIEFTKVIDQIHNQAYEQAKEAANQNPKKQLPQPGDAGLGVPNQPIQLTGLPKLAQGITQDKAVSGLVELVEPDASPVSKYIEKNRPLGDLISTLDESTDENKRLGRSPSQDIPFSLAPKTQSPLPEADLRQTAQQVADAQRMNLPVHADIENAMNGKFPKQQPISELTRAFEEDAKAKTVPATPTEEEQRYEYYWLDKSMDQSNQNNPADKERSWWEWLRAVAQRIPGADTQATIPSMPRVIHAPNGTIEWHWDDKVVIRRGEDGKLSTNSTMDKGQRAIRINQILEQHAALNETGNLESHVPVEGVKDLEEVFNQLENVPVESRAKIIDLLKRRLEGIKSKEARENILNVLKSRIQQLSKPSPTTPQPTTPQPTTPQPTTPQPTTPVSTAPSPTSIKPKTIEGVEFTFENVEGANIHGEGNEESYKTGMQQFAVKMKAAIATWRKQVGEIPMLLRGKSKQVVVKLVNTGIGSGLYVTINEPGVIYFDPIQFAKSKNVVGSALWRFKYGAVAAIHEEFFHALSVEAFRQDWNSEAKAGKYTGSFEQYLTEKTDAIARGLSDEMKRQICLAYSGDANAAMGNLQLVMEYIRILEQREKTGVTTGEFQRTTGKAENEEIKAPTVSWLTRLKEFFSGEQPKGPSKLLNQHRAAIDKLLAKTGQAINTDATTKYPDEWKLWKAKAIEKTNRIVAEKINGYKKKSKFPKTPEFIAKVQAAIIEQFAPAWAKNFSTFKQDERSLYSEKSNAKVINESAIQRAVGEYILNYYQEDRSSILQLMETLDKPMLDRWHEFLGELEKRALATTKKRMSGKLESLYEDAWASMRLKVISQWAKGWLDAFSNGEQPNPQKIFSSNVISTGVIDFTRSKEAIQAGVTDSLNEEDDTGTSKIDKQVSNEKTPDAAPDKKAVVSAIGSFIKNNPNDEQIVRMLMNEKDSAEYERVYDRLINNYLKEIEQERAAKKQKGEIGAKEIAIAEKRLNSKIQEVETALKSHFKSTLGINSADDVLATARFQQGNNVLATAAFSAIDAKDILDVSQTQGELINETMSMAHQANDLINIFSSVGAGIANSTVKSNLGIDGLEGVQREAEIAMPGMKNITRASIKAMVATFPPGSTAKWEFDRRMAWYGRELAVQIVNLEVRLKSVKDHFAKYGAQLLQSALNAAQESARARNKLDTAENTQALFQATVQTAFNQASEIIRYERTTGMRNQQAYQQAVSDLNDLQQIINQTPGAFGCLNDVCSVLSVQPAAFFQNHASPDLRQYANGADLLDRGHAAHIREAYLTSSSSPTYAGSNLLLPVVRILRRSALLREAMAISSSKINSQIRANLTTIGAKILRAIETGRTRRIFGSILREDAKNAVEIERAKRLFKLLHADFLEVLQKYQDAYDADYLARGIESNPNYISLKNEIFSEVKIFGDDKHAPFEFKEGTVMLLPDGTTLNIGGKVGQPNDWFTGNPAKFQARLNAMETARQTLNNYISNPANGADPNLRYYIQGRDFIQDYLLTAESLNPKKLKTLFNKHPFIDGVMKMIELGSDRFTPILRKLVNQWDRTALHAGNVMHAHVYRMSLMHHKAITSHGYDSRYHDVADQINAYYVDVLQQLADSAQKTDSVPTVGMALMSGEKVTKEDLQLIEEMSKACEELWQIPLSQTTKDTLGIKPFFRKAIGYSLIMRRGFDWSAKSFANQFATLHDNWMKADPTQKSQAYQELIDCLDTNFDRYVKPLIRDRSPQFAKPTVFDGIGGAFSVIADGLSNGNLPVQVTNMQELFSALNGMVQGANAESIVMEEFNRILLRVNEVMNGADVKMTDITYDNQGITNSFTQSRNDKVGPYAFYETGFKQGQSWINFCASASAVELKAVMDGVKGSVNDLTRQMKELEDAQSRNKTSARTEIKRNQRMRRLGLTFDNWLNLEKRRNRLNDLLDKIDPNRDLHSAQSRSMLRRVLGIMFQSLLGSITSTIRNVTSGPIYTGHAISRLMAGETWAYPESMYQLWIKETIRWAPRIIGYTAKGLVTIPIGAAKAAYNAVVDKQARKLGVALNTTFRGWVKSIGQEMYENVAAYKELKDRGLLGQTDYLAKFDALTLTPYLASGGMPSMYQSETSLMRMAEYSVGFAEWIISTAMEPMNPAVGDAALNTGIACQIGNNRGPVAWAEKKLKLMFSKLGRSGWMNQFNWNDLRDPQNEILANDFLPSMFIKPALRTKFADMVRMYGTCDLDFNHLAMRYLNELRQGNTQARFMTDAEIDKMRSGIINYANRATVANRPFWLRSAGVSDQLLSTFMGWRIQMFSNFLDTLAVAANDPQYRRITVILATLPLLVTLAVVMAGADWWSEEVDRKLKWWLWNQAKSTRFPWEAEKGKQAQQWALSIANGMPIMDMFVNMMFSDVPSRGRAQPQIMALDKAKAIMQYLGGAWQTGDITYKLPELIGSLLPDTKVILNRLPIMEGKREAFNAGNLLRRYGPAELLRPAFGGAGATGINANPLSIYGDRMLNAAMSGDLSLVQRAYDQGVAKAIEMGRAEPEKLMMQMFQSRNMYDRVFSQKLTDIQREEVLAKMGEGERKVVLDAEDKFRSAMEYLGKTATYTKQQRVAAGTGGGGSGGGAYGTMAGVAAGLGMSAFKKTSQKLKGVSMLNRYKKMSSRSWRTRRAKYK